MTKNAITSTMPHRMAVTTARSPRVIGSSATPLCAAGVPRVAKITKGGAYPARPPQRTWQAILGGVDQFDARIATRVERLSVVRQWNRAELAINASGNC